MLISVLIPTRDRIDLLKLAVASVLREDDPDVEIIVSDNNSESPARPWLEELNDPRIKLIEQTSSLPVTQNWNAATNAASGEYVLMLGDDDALCPEYFTRMRALIQNHDEPDCIYHGAYLFTYPGVVPGRREGQLYESRNAIFWKDGRSTYELPSRVRNNIVRDAIRLKNSYGFNMQFVLLKRELIRRLSTSTGFYDAPYPDYYAMNLVMLEADRVVVSEEPAVTIGVSPKSFGWYHQNSAESSGNAHLGIEERGFSEAGLSAEIYLPGTSMNTHWLLSIAVLYRRLFPETPLPKSSVRNFRYKQLIYLALSYSHAGRQADLPVAALSGLSVTERCFFAIVSAIGSTGNFGSRALRIAHTASQKTRPYLYKLLWRRLWRKQTIIGVPEGSDILDVPRLVARRDEG